MTQPEMTPQEKWTQTATESRARTRAHIVANPGYLEWRLNRILEMREDGATYRQVADVLDISYERVRQIHIRAEEKLRDA